MLASSRGLIPILAWSLFVPAEPARAQCEGPRPARSALIAGAFLGGQATVIALRHDDWWTTPGRSFHFRWGGSANAGQDLLLHGAIAYHVSQSSRFAWDWACTGPAAPWLGALTGFLIGLPKEIGDGVHEGKGFAVDDVAAAFVGAALPALHRTVPETRLVTLKVNWWPSEELRTRPPGGIPQLETDYAGQRYFLSIVPGRVWDAAPVPWLGIAIGHSTASWALTPPQAEWYVTLDVELTQLPIRGRVWRVLASLVDQVKIPLPGLRITGRDLGAGFY